MGNPSMPRLFGRAGESEVRRPSSREEVQSPDLTWKVFRLRERGVKMPREQIVRAAVIGSLRIHVLEGPQAHLIDQHGNELGRLSDVRIRRLLSNGSMLLYGMSLYQDRRTIDSHPQAWWCVLELDGSPTPQD